MSNKLTPQLTLQRGAIPITLDRPRVIFFDMKATWLLVEKYGQKFVSELYAVVPRKDGTTELKLRDVDVLVYFLWAGLQADISPGERLTLEQTAEFIRPWVLHDIFSTLVRALTGGIATPIQPGKAEAASPAPKPAAKQATQKGNQTAAKKVSTLKLRNGLRLER